jgi:hypothetical protein
MMRIFTGGGSSARTRKVLMANGIGEMLTKPLRPNQDCFPLWAFDNGAFKAWKDGKPFDGIKFREWLEFAYRNYPKPYLAVLPDKVGKGMKSFEFSMQWRETLTLYDWPWYLALQDGMDSAAVIEEIDRFSGLFLGGTDDFKKQAGYWKKIAIHNGKPFHYARAGTLGKLAHAIMIGADSVDSTFPLWTKDRLFAFIQALSQQQFPQELLIFERLPKYGEGSLTQVRP